MARMTQEEMDIIVDIKRDYRDDIRESFPPTPPQSFFLAFMVKCKMNIGWVQVVRGGLDFMVNFKVDINSTHGVESLQMDSGSGTMGQGWSGVVSAEV